MALLSPILSRLRCKKISSLIRDGSVLDVGCGNGLLIGFLPEGIEYVGIDSDTTKIKKAIHRNFPNTKFYCLELGKNRIPFMQKFNNIIMCAFIEHVDSPKGILIDLKDHLAEDGRILITTPTERAKKALWLSSKLKLSSSSGFQGHKNYFSKVTLKNYWIKLGFEWKYMKNLNSVSTNLQ